ncbi:MAG: 16S rRNA (uracil(1498)-N(3))-methyltransferase [Deltaproteobacteria bacterium]|nr:16S rRNA (uracil(1498)-N(3))-methyltransferase [Deltaproteobacteria bacterium]MBI4224486.1 16S rRNA (uracil(1498)-N(3))-methyltransferase [Deltaproteobacteria bacterium]
MPQFLLDPKNVQGDFVILPPEEAKHLIKVLRYKHGDTLWVSDGQNRWRAVIEEATPKSARLKLLEKCSLPQTAPAPALGVALLKHDHLEWVLQKGVELGCREFFLFDSARTVPRFWETVTAKKLARFEKILAEAAKQSGLIGHPKIHPPLSFPELTRQFPKFSAVLLAWEEETQSDFAAAFQTLDPSNLLILIGPEGGFSRDEVVLAEKAGAKKISLGAQILRSETAAIALLTLCQYELGNI